VEQLQFRSPTNKKARFPRLFILEAFILTGNYTFF
jgi:hypothetical protein